ncbi:GAF and ANTAR domain-containing protein [Nocardioides anomalus]|uniref:GAF and ANTAR domain-containing protein n=1 Tax=Nocardioides anomalus TaxID=2712223 RepID=A0A6G6W8D2_9ACTN|nr:GAF and ANTAR domain-containing protein [Nocardioides anomalus]QIG41484.1 GAF and ANTAR domain-containing protein [Nocardioides anomalus]
MAEETGHRRMEDQRGVAADYGDRMADLARNLRSQRTSMLTLQYVVQATAEMVKSCDDVAISLAHQDGTVETRASLGAGLAEQADQLQTQFGEGPCVDSAWNSSVVWARDLPHDGSWPSWGSAVVDQLGVRSVLCVQLYTHEDHELGVLQLFATQPHAFVADDADEVIGIAAHAAVALGAISNHEAVQFGLVRRTMIGQATGILMERYQVDPHQAFEVLRRVSQESGRKVYDLAIELVQGGRPSGL